MPSQTGDWINQPKNDWSNWLLLLDKKEPKEDAIFDLCSLGISTNRDEWIYDFDPNKLSGKIYYFCACYEEINQNIKWSRNLKRRLSQNKKENFSEDRIKAAFYRPFIKVFLYYSSVFVDECGSNNEIYPLDKENLVIVITDANSQKPFMAFSTKLICDLHFVGAASATRCFPYWRYDNQGNQIENLTDWSLSRFQQHYADPTITKLDIFHYVYAVLHDPVYRETYALNLKREFPRIPFYPDFRQWAAWGQQLMALHLGYETIEPWPLQRVEKTPSPPAPLPQAGEGSTPSMGGGRVKVRLKADKTAGRIEIDELTILHGVPPEAWDYRLGHRSALEWILEEYKETTPRDPTIREKFNTYRFADHKETVIDLLMRVCRVSVETMQIIAALREAQR